MQHAPSAGRWAVGIGFTAACNMICRFCYSRDLRHAASLPVESWQAFFSRHSHHIAAVNYGTGESTLSDSWFRLARWVRDRYPTITQALTTNGHLAEAVADPKRSADFLAAIDEVDVSIDYADERLHNQLRGNSRAFCTALATLEYCATHAKTTTIVVLGLDSTLAPDNLDALFTIAATYGAAIRINLYRRVHESDEQPPAFDNINQALCWICERHSVVTVSDPLFAALLGIESSGNGRDPSAYRSIRILPTGNITPSTYLVTPEWFAGSIFDDELFAELPDSSAFRLLLDSGLPKPCFGCKLANTCAGGTFDRRLLCYGTLAERDPYCPRRGTRTWRAPRKPTRFCEGPKVHGAYLPTMLFKPGQVLNDE
jgi:radical SAM protein with 4Fe4S-binding SPASM domain